MATAEEHKKAFSKKYGGVKPMLTAVLVMQFLLFATMYVTYQEAASAANLAGGALTYAEDASSQAFQASRNASDALDAANNAARHARNCD